MPASSLLEEAFNAYTKNLEIIIPMAALIVAVYVIALVVLFAVLPIGLVGLLAFKPHVFYGILVATPLLLLLLAIVGGAVSGLCLGVMARMALDVAKGRKASLEGAMSHVRNRPVDFIVLGIIAGLVCLVLGVVPAVGLAVAATPLTFAFLMVAGGSRVSEALGKCIDTTLKALGRRPEVPLVVFLIYVLIAAGSIGVLVALFGVPYAYILAAMHLARETA